MAGTFALWVLDRRRPGSLFVSCGGGEAELPMLLPEIEVASCLAQARALAFSSSVKPRLSTSKSGSEISESESLEVVFGGDKCSAAVLRM